MSLVTILVYALLAYIAIGLLFSFAFIAKGAEAIDKEVASSPKTFRLLLIPGAVLLWPVLALKWINS